MRLDHQIDARNSLGARLSLDRLSDTNPADAVGGLVLPAAARTFTRRAYSAQVSETAALSSRLLNQSRLEFQLASPITRFDPASPSTQFVRPGLATEGESRSANLQNHQAQWADTLSLAAGRHNLRAGGDAIYSSSGGYGQEFGGGVLGQFSRASRRRLPRSRRRTRSATCNRSATLPTTFRSGCSPASFRTTGGCAWIFRSTSGCATSARPSATARSISRRAPASPGTRSGSVVSRCAAATAC